MEHREAPSGNKPFPNRGTKYRRLKVTVACDACRARKVKCDNIKPVCGSCQKRLATDCVYSGSKEATDSSLEERHLKDPLLHKTLIPQEIPQQYKNDRLLGGASRTDSLMSGERQFLDPSSAIRRPPEAENHFPGTGSPEHRREKSEELCGADSMNGVTGDPTQTCEIFGSSNAGSFMRQVQAAVDASPDASQTPVMTTKKFPLSIQSARQHFDDPDLMFLPPKGLADGLMLSYWDNQWQLYPIIPRREIETIYESLWRSTTMDHLQLAHVSLINICFALGCQYCQLLQPDKRMGTGSHFFARADRLHQKLEDGPSLEKVQYLLLSGIYLQSTNKVFQCWMTVGQAIRMAQSLGLHLSQPQPSSETIIQSEYRRRTWHGCVWLDRVLSATFGRPGLIAGFLSDSVPLPSMVDDEDLNANNGTLSGCSNASHLRITFFIEAIKLYRILGEILARLYLISMRNDKFQSNLVHIIEIDGQLQSWQESLPNHLRDHSIAETDTILKRHSIVLRIRFLHVRTLLFRPALIYYCQSVNLDHTPDTSLAQCLITQCSQLCFRIAREVISIFHCNLDAETLGGPVPCWWYSVLYLYTAATVVFVERYLEKKNGLTAESPASLAWDAALCVLRSYSILGGSAKKCVSALEYLSEKLPDEKETVNTEMTQDHLAENMSALWEMPDLFSGNVDLTDSVLLPFDLGGMNWLD